MAELIVALAPLILLAGLALTAIFVPLQVLAGFALALMAVGFVLGMPAGLGYHVVLRRELLRVGPLPHRWYWSPQSHHHLLDASALGRLRPWFVVGAGGFLLIIIGFALAALALALWFRAGG
jgi:hypothetical protein